MAFFSLAAVVLAITGAEALYADLGHFGRAPITRAWLLLVFPACILSYMGQGALVLADPARGHRSPFFLLVPEWGAAPMVVLATAATVIASQAVITGAFSVAHQAVQLGYLPRLRIAHTSERTIGQIYVPWINWVLMVSVLTLVFAFRTSTALAFAFGDGGHRHDHDHDAAVLLHRPPPVAEAAMAGAGRRGGFLAVDLLFLAANLTKLTHGAWLPLLIGVTVFTMLTTWQRGRALVTARREQREGSLRAFIDELHDRHPPLQRVPGTAVFLNRGKPDHPAGHARQRRAQPHPARARRDPLDRDAAGAARAAAIGSWIDDLGYADDGITHVGARFGYMDEPNVPGVLRLAARRAWSARSRSTRPPTSSPRSSSASATRPA